MRLSIFLRLAMFGVSLFLFGQNFAYAQGATGTIFGTVADPSGAVVPGAQITVTNSATSAVRTTETNELGNYSLPSLVPGRYDVEVSMAGFRDARAAEVELLVEQDRDVSFVLELGTGVTEVSVVASTVELDTQTPSLGEVITAKPISDLPLNGRNYITLTHLAPGVIPMNSQVGDGAGPAFFTGNRKDVSVSIAGNREMDMIYTYDGVESKSYFFGAVGLFPPPDAIEEFKVQKNFFSPEFGPPAVVNLITKTGGDTIHGNVWEFHRNDNLNARNFFDADLPEFKFNQFGAAVGGPFPKSNKHHWFAYVDILRSRKGQTLLSTVPSAQQLQGDFQDLVPGVAGGGCPYDPQNASGLCMADPTSQIIDPLTGAGFDTPNVIPASRINSFAAVMVPLFRPPNKLHDARGNYSVSPSVRNDGAQYSIRTDHTLSEKDRVFGRFTWSNSDLITPGIFPYVGVNTPLPVRNVAIGWTRIVRPTLVNEFRVGYNKNRLGFVPEPGFDINALNYRNVTPFPECNAPPNIGISGTSGFPSTGGVLCLGGGDQDLAFYNNVAWTRGNHTLTFGADIRETDHRVRNDLFLSGVLGYNYAFSGNNLADFMLGHPSDLQFSDGTTTGTHEATWHQFYINDNFRVTQKLTLNLGLRYENNDVPAPLQGNARTFDPMTASLVSGGQGRFGPGIADRDNNDLAPRFGFAYRATENFVIRGGYGIYYSHDPNDEWSFNTFSPPTFGQVFINGDPNIPDDIVVTVNENQPTDLIPDFDPALVPDDGTDAGSITLLSKQKARNTPNVQQWNVSIQRTLPGDTLLEIAYVGTKGTHLSKRVDQNIADPLSGPDDTRSIQERRPFPRWGGILTSTNRGNSNYHALQVRFEKAYSNGLSFLAGYTWSRAMSEDDYDNLGSRNYHRTLLDSDYGRALYDRRQRFVFSFTYELPVAQSAQGVAGQVLRGWRVTAINQFMTGAPFAIRTGVDYAQVGTAFGFSRPDRICNGNLPPSQRTVERWIDTSCFVAPDTPYPHLGNSSFNFLDTDGISEVTIGLHKEVGSEKFRVQFRAEFFNSFNFPNFNNPDNSIDSATFGTVLGAQDAREIQFGLKLIF